MTAKLCLFSLLFLPLFSLSQSYKKLHQKALVVDTHNDVMISMLTGLQLQDDLSGKTHSDLARFKKGGVDVQIFSIWSDENYGTGKGFNYANRQLDTLYASVARNTNKMMIVKSPADLKTAVHQKKLGVMMGLEGGHMMEDSLQYLDSLYKRGIRYMTLTWNNSTSWATSAKDETAQLNLPGREARINPPGEKAHLNLPGGKTLKDSANRRGLTEFGKTIVRRMNELGMLVDLSHVGERTFWDAINTTTKPVIVSHSCVYALCPVPRNLRDDQIKAIGKNGGVIHLNFYSGFLDSNYNRRKEAFTKLHAVEVDSLKKAGWPSFEIDMLLSKKYPSKVQGLRAPLSLLLDHLDYIVSLIGVGGVGIGSDFDGIESPPLDMDDVTYLPNITKGLLQRGYSKGAIRKILGGNFLRIFKAAQSGKN